MPATTRSNRYRDRSESSSPNRSESSTAIGRAPSANTSRRIPPTPVAAPWNGSTALGWLWDSTLKAIARAHQHPVGLGRQSAQELARVLVSAVFGPKQREHRQLHAVRLALNQLADAVVFGVGEAERPVSGVGGSGARHRAESIGRTRSPTRERPSTAAIASVRGRSVFRRPWGATGARRRRAHPGRP